MQPATPVERSSNMECQAILTLTLKYFVSLKKVKHYQYKMLTQHPKGVDLTNEPALHTARQDLFKIFLSRLSPQKDARLKLDTVSCFWSQKTTDEQIQNYHLGQ